MLETLVLRMAYYSWSNVFNFFNFNNFFNFFNFNNF